MDIITPQFAEATLNGVSGDYFKSFMTVAGWLLGIVAVLWGLRQKTTRLEPDPLRVEKIDKLASREFVSSQFAEAARRLNGHDADIAAIRQDMKEDRRNNDIHASQRSAGLHQKIDNVRVELSEKIDGMEARIIATLKNTGAI